LINCFCFFRRKLSAVYGQVGKKHKVGKSHFTARIFLFCQSVPAAYLCHVVLLLVRMFIFSACLRHTFGREMHVRVHFEACLGASFLARFAFHPSMLQRGPVLHASLVTTRDGNWPSLHKRCPYDGYDGTCT
jgi:hypothetical protein